MAKFYSRENVVAKIVQTKNSKLFSGRLLPDETFLNSSSKQKRHVIYVAV